MFKGLKNLRELDLRSFDTYNVEDMDGMFQNCSKKLCVNISSFTEWQKDVNMIYKMFHPEGPKFATHIHLNGDPQEIYKHAVYDFIIRNMPRIRSLTDEELQEIEYFINQGHYRDPIFPSNEISAYNFIDEEVKYNEKTRRIKDRERECEAIREIDKLNLTRIENYKVTSLQSLKLGIDLKNNELINEQIGNEETKEITLEEVLDNISIDEGVPGIANSGINKLSDEGQRTSAPTQEATNIRIDESKDKNAKLKQAFEDTKKTSVMKGLQANIQGKDSGKQMAANNESRIEDKEGRAGAVKTKTTRKLSNMVNRGSEHTAQSPQSDGAQQGAPHRRTLPKRLDMEPTGDEVIIDMVTRLYREVIQPIARDVVSIVNTVKRELTGCLGVIRKWF